MPASAVVALERVGFCSAEVKPFGPVHEYVAPATVGVESAIVAPSQYGPPLDALGVAGVALTTTLVVPAGAVERRAGVVGGDVPAPGGVAVERGGVCGAEGRAVGAVRRYMGAASGGVRSG